MALPINVEDLLNKRKIEGNRIEFKKGWNPADIYHSLCAFANDFDNLGGGYVLVGVEQDDNGLAKRPVKGINIDAVDGILKKMVGYNNMFDPYYLPRTSLEEVDGQQVLVIWAPSGVNRPYAIPMDVTAKEKKMKYYVRSGSSSIEAKGEVLDELREMANRVPFDERPNPEITLNDISMVLLRDYLATIGSKLEASLFTQPLAETLEQMELMTGPTENRMIKNVAAMMFCEHPEKFFKYTQIDIVIFPEGRVKGPNNFSETTIRGSVPQIIKGALSYLKTTVLREYVFKVSYQEEANRFWNYPLAALEEVIVNAMYHRDYQQYEPVEISVEPEGISVLSFPGPDRSISKTAIERGERLVSRRYRNRRLGDFLKELDLTEGRSTGIPTIQEEMQENGSPRATIETNDERNFINVFIPIHEGCEKTVVLNGTQSGTQDVPQDVPQGVPQGKLDDWITEQIQKNPNITTKELGRLCGLNSKTIQRHISKLSHIEYVGSGYSGHWKIIDTHK